MLFVLFPDDAFMIHVLNVMNISIYIYALFMAFLINENVAPNQWSLMYA